MLIEKMAFRVVSDLLLLCLLQILNDFNGIYGSPNRRLQRSKSFNGNLPYHENSILHENLFGQREQIRESSLVGKTAGKSQQMEDLFKLKDNRDGNSPINLKKLLNRVYLEGKSTKKVYSSQESTPSYAQSVRRFNKDYVFRAVVYDDNSNAYAVAYSPKEHSETNWYITSVAGAVILVVVVALCVHLPWGCLWRRQRSEHDVSCPITDSEKRICGKCMLHRDATKTMTYNEKPHQASVTMATRDRHYRASSGNLYSQNSLPHNNKQSGKLNQAKSKVSSLFKGSHGSHSYEPAKYRYKRLRATEKEQSQHTNYEPEWTSIGAFLNRRPSTYGSTRESKEKFVDRYGRRSRDSLNADDEVVEYALKLRPRRRQMIELQEFPLGFSKSYLNIDLESDPGVVFDPCRDQFFRKKTKVSDRLTFSDSDLRKLSCMDKLGTYNDSENLFDGGKRRKSSLKTRSRKGKGNAKVVTFFPSNLSYDAQFVQIPPRNKMAETGEGEFEKRFIAPHREPHDGFKRVDTKATPSFNQTKAVYDDLAKIAGDTKDEFPFTDGQKAKIKEHAIDCDTHAQSFYVEAKRDEMLQARDCASSYVNYGCRSSTEVLTESKEKLPRDEENERDLTYNFDSFSSSFSDLRKNDLGYKPEPLAGLLSPVRRANPKGGNIKGIMTSQAAGDLVCVSSYVQPLSMRCSMKAVSMSNGCNIYQPQLDDTRPFQSNKSQSDFEQEVLFMEKTSCYDNLQQYPEKETRTES